MVTGSSSQTGGTTTNAASSSRNGPPTWVWIVVSLSTVLVLGALAFLSHLYINRLRARPRARARPRLRDNEGEDGSGGSGAAGDGSRGGSTRSARHGGRRHRRQNRFQPAARWGWVYSNNNDPATTQSTEGLNELGEAPPPYNPQEHERPKSYTVEMIEIRDVGEGPSRARLRQDPNSEQVEAAQRESTGTGPPGYELAVNLGAESTLPQEPRPTTT